jgi:hypothetical protein
MVLYPRSHKLICNYYESLRSYIHYMLWNSQRSKKKSNLVIKLEKSLNLPVLTDWELWCNLLQISPCVHVCVCSHACMCVSAHASQLVSDVGLAVMLLIGLDVLWVWDMVVVRILAQTGKFRYLSSLPPRIGRLMAMVPVRACYSCINSVELSGPLNEWLLSLWVDWCVVVR